MPSNLDFINDIVFVDLLTVAILILTFLITACIVAASQKILVESANPIKFIIIV